jgi:hypothetical protein
MNIPAKVQRRLADGLKKFQPILTQMRARDVSESDTGKLIVDVLSEVLGYDKYSEVTSEHSIRGTFCDLAITLDGELQTLIEVKAIGIGLADKHVKQAVDYGANQGVEWVVLTNGITWRVYRLVFAKPINAELIVEFDMLALNAKDPASVEQLFLLCKEGWNKSVLGEYFTQKQALSRYYMAATLLTEPVLDVIRRELRRISPDVRIDSDAISKVLASEVIKRDCLEGEKADEARKGVRKAAGKTLRAAKERPPASSSGSVEDAAPPDGEVNEMASSDVEASQ